MTSIHHKHVGHGFHAQNGMPIGANRHMSKAEASMVQAAVRANIQVNINVHLDGFHPPRHIGDICGHKPRPCYPKPPKQSDKCHPQGSLKTSPDGAVTTPGGYKIETLGPCEWKITGPDGKNTRVWGDPHVAEGDGGTWDFKRDSTFMLGDGTRINVSTKPAGPNVTVTGGLEIISGNDRVQITDVDKGKGKTGPVTHDGFAHANSFGNKDVFVMGKETDDWSFQGKEIIGSNNFGETFKLGNDLPAGVSAHKPGHHHRADPRKSGVGGPQVGQPGILPGEPAPGTQPMQGPQANPGTQANPFAEQLQALLQTLLQQFQTLMPFGDMLSQRNCGNEPFCASGREGPWMDRRQQHLNRGFDDIGMMMNAFFQMDSLSRSIQSMRGGFMA